MTLNSVKPVVLIILDGWGVRDDEAHNAVKLASTPVLDELERIFPTTLLDASGEAVGLPEGQMGNSEAGHLNLGAGRVVYQELTRIDKAINDGSFFHIPAFLDAIEHVKKTGGNLHLCGLLSDGGVHSSDQHLYSLLQLAKEQGITKVFIHAFLDGRDTPPRSAEKYIMDLEERCQELGTGIIASVMGRYYAMDRDQRWERTSDAFNAIVRGQASVEDSALVGLKKAYAARQDDEFVKPFIITEAIRQLSRSMGQHGTVSLISQNDSVICFNFRPDRVRQLTEAITRTEFHHFERGEDITFPHFVTFTMYKEDLELPVAFAPEPRHPCLGEVISSAGRKQLRVAETEKYAHVTFFFNGGSEYPFPGEERALIPSPRVKTYDELPQMSAEEVKNRVVLAIDSANYGFILVNFANLDMVGHTGDLKATIVAVETVDSCVGQIINSVRKSGGEALITADHGNAERMLDEATGQAYTAHGTSKVKLIAVTDRFEMISPGEGKLSDVAPTVLAMMGLEKPATMTAKSLLSEKSV